ncbi:MAG: tRNA pseudouridine(38-40) synthase TruA [Thermodesulfobacteriota bacterium]
MRNIKLILEYDGTAYCGWQRQVNGLSIQEVLEEKIGVMTGEAAKVIGSGRTDAGVHAMNQAANFKAASNIPVDGFLRGLNSLLPQDIAVKEVCEVPADFHARYSASEKIYLYRILNERIRSPLHHLFTWFVPHDLAFAAMERCLPVLQGVHDFAAFMASGSSVKSTTRIVSGLKLTRKDKIIEFEIRANGFLRHMVRNIVGTLVEVGQGRVTPEKFADILQARDRNMAGMTAPPQGLFLKEVIY